MSSNDSYISKYVFGSVEGLKYLKKNLIHVVDNPEDYIIKDTSIQGYSFIEITEGKIKISEWNNNKWCDRLLTVDQFWNNTKHRKKYICLIKVDN